MGILDKYFPYVQMMDIYIVAADHIQYVFIFQE